MGSIGSMAWVLGLGGSTGLCKAGSSAMVTLSYLSYLGGRGAILVHINHVEIFQFKIGIAFPFYVSTEGWPKRKTNVVGLGFWATLDTRRPAEFCNHLGIPSCVTKLAVSGAVTALRLHLPAASAGE